MVDHEDQAAARTEAGLGLVVHKRAQAIGHFEPSLKLRFLPRCPVCGAVHPRAQHPPLDTDECLTCRTVICPHPEVEVGAVLTNVPLRARIALKLGRLLYSLHKRLS